MINKKPSASLPLSTVSGSQKTVFGHAGAMTTIKSLYDQGNLAPCWIVWGQRGIGKSTLAYQLAREILSANPQNPNGLSPEIVGRQIANGAYPNLFVLTRGNNKDGDLNTVISVEDSRKVIDFLRQSPSIPGWRVVIIDAVDDLTRQAANALLKILEEPPQKALILLICHSLGQALPTIRSRCQKLLCQPLTAADFLDWCPDFDEGLFPLVRGSIGLYQSLQAAGGGIFVQQLDEMAMAARSNNFPKAQKWCETVAKNPSQYDCFLWLIEQWAYQKILNSTDTEQSHWLGVWQAVTSFLKDARSTHLDKTHVLITCFLMIENPTRIIE
ncbi:MAG: AAA family ATPase [Alphaproteobacteria bacterium]|nr:AAA family ATPase [Alphaproteobacteria bacterium]